MANPLFNQLAPKQGNNMIQQFLNFKKNFKGDPQQMVQNMLNSGKISQAQVNQLAQRANQIYSQFKNLI